MDVDRAALRSLAQAGKDLGPDDEDVQATWLEHFSPDVVLALLDQLDYLTGIESWDIATRARKVAELEQRCRDLEAQNEIASALIIHLEWDCVCADYAECDQNREALIGQFRAALHGGSESDG